MHGTFPKCLDPIFDKGLLRMTRRHVHMLPKVDGKALRTGCSVLIAVDLRAASRDGIPVFHSSNGYLLSPGEGETGCIPPRYLRAAISRKTGAVLRGEACVLRADGSVQLDPLAGAAGASGGASAGARAGAGAASGGAAGDDAPVASGSRDGLSADSSAGSGIPGAGVPVEAKVAIAAGGT